MSEAQVKFTSLLKEMFQFDQVELDFGIYRIMNAKHAEIEKFLNEDLPQDIATGLSRLKTSTSAEQLKKINEQIASLKSVDVEASQKEGLIAKLEEQKARLESVTDTQNAEEEIYNRLLEFFSRYYDAGDFISQRRYSDGKYAIPYEGEEVKLHWANADQYYIKTSEYFKDYTFSDGSGHKIHFKLLDAEVEQNNNKSKEKRYFFLTENEKKFEMIDKELFIYFEYRTSKIKLTGRDPQKGVINKEIIESFTQFLNDNLTEFQEFATIVTKAGSSESSFLEKKLNHYTQRNQSDYFIHKDLGKFLNRELDFFIKNEIIRLDDIDESDEAKTRKQLTKARVIREIGQEIIKFLAQLENFQKKLFLKKKFVTETNYCITLDRIDEQFYKEIVANDKQREEWIKLFAIDEIKAVDGNLLEQEKVAYSEPLTIQFLKENPYLVLDTAFFSEEFKEKLIASIDNFEDKLNGLLINSENFQALNTLQEKYREKVKTIYIDPPYNTEGDGFIYKDNYRDSSWLSMMRDRLILARNLIKKDGTFFSSIDHNEIHGEKYLSEQIFKEENFEGLITWRRRHNQPNDKTKMIGMVSEYILSYAKDSESYKTSGVGKVALTGKFSNPDNDPRGEWASKPWKVGSDQSGTRYKITSPDGTVFEEDWMGDENTYNKLLSEGRIYFPKKSKKDGGLPRKKYYKSERMAEGQCATNWWSHEEFGHNQGANDTLTSLFGEKNKFSNPKPIELVCGIIDVSHNENELTLDFFAGSGTTAHAVINLNREDDGNRKYILCEMGEYFDTVTKPRVEKVIYSKEWKEGKPVNCYGSSHAFKYIRLESYEDTLNNITFNKPQSDSFEQIRKDYTLSYMLDFESKDSSSLLDLDKLAHPFDYTLKITRNQESKDQKIDLIETFNYLIGLKVYKAYPKNSTYNIKAIEGSVKEGEKVLVLWRDLTGNVLNDNETLDNFIKEIRSNYEKFDFKRIYVNGDNNLLNLKPDNENWDVVLIEAEMKKLMFVEC